MLLLSLNASCLQTQEVAAKVYATAEHPIVARVLVMLAKIQVHWAATWRRTRI